MHLARLVVRNQGGWLCMCVRCRDDIAMHRVREKERAGSTLHGFIVAPAELDALMNGWVRFGVAMWSYVCAMSF